MTPDKELLLDEIGRVAREAFGWHELRSAQVQAIVAAVEGRDVLAVMPTGYGKSAIYQVAAALLEGAAVVVSPLIALQTDQVASLVSAPDAPPAVAVNSGQTDTENADAWHAVTNKRAKYLFLSPEQLTKESVLASLKQGNVTLFVVDEAHCVSSWGHEFRPDYLRLGEVVKSLGRPTTLALTATGSPPVREEVME